MRPKSLLLLILALGCGLVASIGITQVMAKRDGGADVAGMETEPVLVAVEKVSQFTPLTAQVLKIEEWPKGKIPEGAIANLEDIEGRRTRTVIYPGEPILETKLFNTGDSEHGALMLIPKGHRVISVKVDTVSGGSGLILPGDRVDVAVTLRADHARGIPETTTKTFLQDVKVFAVNDQFQVDGSSDDKSITAKTVSLLVTPKQAQDVMVAGEAGKIQLVMRSPDEEKQEEVPASSLSELLGTKRQGGDRSKESLVQQPSEPQESLLSQKFKAWLDNKSRAAVPGGSAQPSIASQGPKTWEVEVIKADQVEQVVLEQQDGKWRVSNSSGYAPVANTTSPFAAPPAPPQPGATPPSSDGPSDGPSDDSSGEAAEADAASSPQD